VIFGSVQSNQYVIVQSAEGVQAARYALQCCDRFGEDRIEQFWFCRIHGSNLIVGGNPRDAEQGLTIRTPVAILELFLVIEEGWACMKNAENAAIPKSAIRWVDFMPRRLSGSRSKHRRNESRRNTRTHMPLRIRFILFCGAPL
jgi:hypothetical protein